ncbi:hypothetical protein QFZ49_002793 [Streptomyces turgidiscabies]|uniref:DUF4190 domain-containing protein n=1 Tax=Streptomyces turgidiscabies TaxID=85558 RepID=A0ABU0RME3_9ACTN|nr:hypothetical protein [Streptomyces turgidiscabies]
MQLTASATGRTAPRDPDGMAVASFVLGLLGLLVLNVFLGPVAITLAVVALWRGTKRPGRRLARPRSRRRRPGRPGHPRTARQHGLLEPVTAGP